MIFEDVAGQAWRAVAAHRQRSALTMLGIVIGIASVILLTSIGEGTRVYILSEFTQFGTNLMAVTPGKTETSGMPSSFAGTIHPLTLADAQSLDRLPWVTTAVPVVAGAAPVEYDGLRRNVFVQGVSEAATDVWRMNVRVGRFLPPGDLRYGSPVTVLGPTLKRELFGDANALGEHVRIGGQRFLVIGIMESKGQFVGIDIDDTAYIPVALAMPLFGREDLQEIDVLVSHAAMMDSVAAMVRTALIDRHRGEEDFTITTQTGMLDSLDRILGIVSLAVAGIGGISLLVGAIGILTMMWISVHERTPEIGLAKAIGAAPRQILMLYLGEAILLATTGGALGLVAGIGLAQLLHLFVPALPIHTPLRYVVAVLAISFVVGVLSGILPARRAARLDPVQALAAD
ncbi:MAG: ABC transporter permease [Candidatus Eisenbacteria bacterium]|uniref:ABC transporter permease n=1 Tax=Eiseniibacteriota bacterium TaxID=2212470 RepID=A0A956M062_UNCEI|nr:ABC transporter permease [Candidatus Eisenbacteria bacterium]